MPPSASRQGTERHPETSLRPGRTVARVTGVHLGIEPVRRGELRDERREGLTLLGAQRLEHVRILLFRGGAQHAEHGTARLSGLEPVVPPVGRIPGPRDEAGRLQGVDEHHHAARDGPQSRGELALAQAGLAGDDPEHAGRGGSEAGRLDELAESGCGERTELGEEEPGAGGTASGSHPSIITSLTERFIVYMIIPMTEFSRSSRPDHAGDRNPDRHGVDQRRAGGPPLGPLAIVALALTIAGIAALVLGSGSAPDPFAPPSEIADWYAVNPATVRIGALLQFGSAVPLGILTASIYARQLRLGVRVPGPVIGLYGGALASIALLSSALVTWSLGFPDGGAGSPETTAVLARLAFGFGGVGYATGLGLLMAGIAVPALILRFVPRWLAWAGLVLAGLGEVSFLSLGVEPLQTLLPIVRFGGGAWLIAIAFLLPHSRPKRGPEPFGAPGSGHDRIGG